MVKLSKVLPALLLATFAAASINITAPSKDIWWVAESTNVMTWGCQDTSIVDFTVFINNTDPKILTDILAFIAIQANDDCSITVSSDQVNQTAAPGYTLIFTNPLNFSDIYATSELFEIKALGSLYPSQVTSTGSVASGTGSSNSPSTTSTKSGGAPIAYNPSFIGLAGVMGLLAVGMLGA